MKCDDFNPERYAIDLVEEADGRNMGLRVIEAYCHSQTCPDDMKRFFEYIVLGGSRNPSGLNYAELGMISDMFVLDDVYGGMSLIENLVNPDSSILDES